MQRRNQSMKHRLAKHAAGGAFAAVLAWTGGALLAGPEGAGAAETWAASSSPRSTAARPTTSARSTPTRRPSRRRSSSAWAAGPWPVHGTDLVSHPASSFPRELLLAPRDRPRFLPRVHRADSRPRGAFPGADRQRPDRMECRRDTHRPRHDGLACPKGPPASGGRGRDMRPDVFGCSDGLRVVGRCRAGPVSGCPRKLTGHGRTRYGCRPGLDPQDRGRAGAD